MVIYLNNIYTSSEPMSIGKTLISDDAARMHGKLSEAAQTLSSIVGEEVKIPQIEIRKPDPRIFGVCNSGASSDSTTIYVPDSVFTADLSRNQLDRVFSMVLSHELFLIYYNGRHGVEPQKIESVYSEKEEDLVSRTLKLKLGASVFSYHFSTKKETDPIKKFSSILSPVAPFEFGHPLDFHSILTLTHILLESVDGLGSRDEDAPDKNKPTLIRRDPAPNGDVKLTYVANPDIEKEVFSKLCKDVIGVHETGPNSINHYELLRLTEVVTSALGVLALMAKAPDYDSAVKLYTRKPEDIPGTMFKTLCSGEGDKNIRYVLKSGLFRELEKEIATIQLRDTMN